MITDTPLIEDPEVPTLTPDGVECGGPPALEPELDDAPVLNRQSMEVDIACTGFGPAMGGFLTTLNHAWRGNPADPAFQSKTVPGMPLQVLCYERADDIAAGVSGVVTRAKGIRGSFPHLRAADIPMAVEVRRERVLYLMDPHGASRRSWPLRAGDTLLRALGPFLGVKDDAFQLPWIPGFLEKRGGLVLSIGQFNQWVGAQLMADGLVQIWPGSPVKEPLFSSRSVLGLRLLDQGVDKHGAATDGFTPGMDVRARLTVVGDGPVGAIGEAIDRRVRLPAGHARHEWAMGMKMVIELPPDPPNPDPLDTAARAAEGILANPGQDDAPLQPGTVWHTFGYPEPEIFGFLYVHPDRLVSVGIFVPSWMRDSSRTCYRYLQHYIQHPALWRYLKGGTLRSWGAKSLNESGRLGEPYLCGNGYARIGEGSGSTNMLTGSGVDEAWTTGVQLAESVIALLRAGKEFTSRNLESTYEVRRRESWVENGARDAENARAGFHGGVVRGLMGMALAGMTGGKLSSRAKPATEPKPKSHRAEMAEERQRQRAAELASKEGRPFHDALLSTRGWPEVAFDGRLLVSHQDALLIGGKVQATPGFPDHVAFRDRRLCAACDAKSCVAMCSGQAITLGAEGLPVFEREKCVHCGGCLWNCAMSPDGIRSNIEFRAGPGGLHSAEN